MTGRPKRQGGEHEQNCKIPHNLIVQAPSKAINIGVLCQNDITKLSFRRLGVYPRSMTELDQFWSEMIDRAATRALTSGNGDIVDYLRLRAANDAIRAEGVKWLFDSAIEIAGSITRSGPTLNIERTDPHSFARGTSNMVGSKLTLQHGVRCLTIEAGWTRTPSDGIMRGGVLAAARLVHFGIGRSNADLSLLYSGDLPIWHFDDLEGNRRPLRLVDLNRHFDLLIGR